MKKNIKNILKYVGTFIFLGVILFFIIYLICSPAIMTKDIEKNTSSSFNNIGEIIKLDNMQELSYLKTTETTEMPTSNEMEEKNNEENVISETVEEIYIEYTEPTEVTAEEFSEDVTDAPENYPLYSITNEERDMLAAIIYLEAGNVSYQCQAAICSVIINRWNSGYWGNSLYDVIYAPNQFTPAEYINSTTPTQTQYDVINDIIYNGTTVPYYVMYFRADYYFDWCEPYTNIDNVYFSYNAKDV